MTAEELIVKENRLKEIIDLHITKTRIKDYARWSNWAGDLGFDCDTYQTLCRLKPECKPLPNLELAKIFRASGILESPNLILMSEAGLKIIEQGRPYTWREKKISGRIDAKIEMDFDVKPLKVPLEHKALSPNVYRVIKTHKDRNQSLTKSKYSWVRKYPGQLTVYELMDGSEFGVWFFYNKVSGDYFFWIVPIDLSYAEELVQRAERTNMNVEAGTVPTPERKEICQGCDFELTYCFTGKEAGEGWEFISDEEFDHSCERWLELKPLHKEFDEIDKEFKERFEGKTAVTEKFRLDSKQFKMKIARVPKDIKDKFLEEIDAYRFSIKRLTGKKNEYHS